MGYFGYALGATGVMTYAMRNSAMVARLPWWGLLAGSLGLMLGTHMTDYD